MKAVLFQKEGCMNKMVFLVVALLCFFGGIVAGAAFAVKTVLLALFLFCTQKRIQKLGRGSKWCIAVLSVLVLTPTSPIVTALAAVILATMLFYKNISLQNWYMANAAVMAIFTVTGIFVADLAFATETGLSKIVTSIGNLASSVTKAVPICGYAVGAGFAGTGLVEIVKSKNGQGGDLGAGFKKLLIGGGLAGLGTMIDMVSHDMTGSNAGQTGTQATYGATS